MTDIDIILIDPEKNKDIPLPEYMTEGSSGMDIYAAVEEPTALAPGEIALISTGLAMAIPYGFEAQIRPRSGLAVKHGVTVVNAPGTIDSDYRGEIKVGLINLGQTTFVIKRGIRIAQMVIQKIERVNLIRKECLDDTERSHGGFGHTGVN